MCILQRFRALRGLSNSHIQTLIPIQSTSRSAWMAVDGSFAGSEASPPSRLCMKLQLEGVQGILNKRSERRRLAFWVLVNGHLLLCTKPKKNRQKRQKGQGYTWYARGSSQTRLCTREKVVKSQKTNGQVMLQKLQEKCWIRVLPREDGEKVHFEEEQSTNAAPYACIINHREPIEPRPQSQSKRKECKKRVEEQVSNKDTVIIAIERTNYQKQSWRN